MNPGEEKFQAIDTLIGIDSWLSGFLIKVDKRQLAV
jgi:hypothetical protein